MEQLVALHGSFYFEYFKKDVFMCLRIFVHVRGDAVRPENIGSQETGSTGSYEPPDMRLWN